ncbi:MAG: hypothetical protein MUF54_05005 [Polyangiaceae bacterium]|jgi:hypothetical protein|nr:hypothetical protein [Polyangiaceae bacterium]
MPAFIAPLIGIVLGIAFAWSSADELSSDPTSVLGTRSLVVTTLFSVLVFVPVAGYFVAFHGDWAFAYLLNTRNLPSAATLALVLLDAVTVPIGFVLAAPHARRHRLNKLLSLAAGPTGAAMLLMLLFARRFSTSATFAQFHGDFGTLSVAGTPLGYALVWMNGVLAVALALTVRALRRLSAAGQPTEP